MPVRGFDDAKNAEAVYTKNELDPSLTVLDGHVADTVIHVTAAEKTAWNAKVGLDPETGRVAKDQLPEDTVYGEAGAAGGIATLGSDGRLPLDQAPLGTWRSVSVAAIDSGSGIITREVEITEARARIIFNAGAMHIFADYDKASETLNGIIQDAVGWTFGNVAGEVVFTLSTPRYTVTLSANGNGLLITEDRGSGSWSSGDFPGGIVQIRRDG